LAISFVCFLLLDEVEDGGGWIMEFACKGQKLKRGWLDSGVLFLGSFFVTLFLCATMTLGWFFGGGATL
jgi:hypothetical protein